MKECHISRDKMQWLEMDILDLQFEDDSFDLVIDKGKPDYTFRPKLTYRNNGVG